MDNPVTPRPSASLILMRDNGDIPSVLMGTRNKSMRFMPGYLVFPGGTVDPEDSETAGNLPIHPATAEGLARHSRIGDGRAYLWAAIRETVEETGLRLRSEETWQTVTDDSSAAAFSGNHERPATEWLDLIGRAITPESSPIRFDALFFLAAGDLLAGRMTPNEELEGVAWHRADLALAADAMADVTRFMLARALTAWCRRKPHEPTSGPVPTYTYGNSDTPVIMHEDGRVETLLGIKGGG